MIGGGIVGLATSYYLSQNPNTDVTLLDKNKHVLGEASGQDMALFMLNQTNFRTLGAQPFGQLDSLLRVDGPNAIYSTHMAQEPAVPKFLWHWLHYTVSGGKKDENTTFLHELTKESWSLTQQVSYELQLNLPSTTCVSLHKLNLKNSLDLSNAANEWTKQNKKWVDLLKLNVKSDMAPYFAAFPKYVKQTTVNSGSGIN